MKITKTVALVWLAASLHSFGAVEATLVHISSNATFTVPAGKVLIIENATDFGRGLRLQKTTNIFDLDGDADGGLRLVRLPLKVPEGWTIQAVVEFGESTDVWIFGLLVSPSDLFASAKHRIDQIGVNGGMASFGVQMASPRPAQISVEKSSETGQGWQAAENAVVSPTSDKSRYVATVPVAGDKGFIRTKARPRVR